MRAILAHEWLIHKNSQIQDNMGYVNILTLTQNIFFYQFYIAIVLKILRINTQCLMISERQKSRKLFCGLSSLLSAMTVGRQLFP